MKIFLNLFIISLVLPLCLWPSGKAHALTLGTNITVYDGSSSEKSGWYGQNEDNEVEPDCVTTQEWDLEGFFLKGSKLQVVGGFDFKNGYKDIQIGDIFLDVDGSFNPDAYWMTGNGNVQVNSNFGYEYVLDLDVQNGSYDIYDISTGSIETTTVYYEINHHSNAYRYVSGGTKIGSGTLTYLDSLSDSDVDGLLGDTHYALTGFDLGFIAGQDFTAHLTLGCGNDDLEGSGTAPVPEPATILLMGSGLAILGGLGRKRARDKKA